MKVVIDIEANGLVNPTKIWVIVCKDIDTGELHVFRNVTDDVEEKVRFRAFANQVVLWIGHNLIGYDAPVLKSLDITDECLCCERSLDTLIVSKLVDYSRPNGHSLEAYGQELGYPKGDNTPEGFFKRYSKKLEEYCIQDVEITLKVYLKYLKYINNPLRKPSILLEHKFQLIVNSLSTNGFSFNTLKAKELLKEVEGHLKVLDTDILREFPPRLRLIREVTPKVTKFGTISKSSIPRVFGDDLSPFNEGATFSYCTWEEFNPSSHKQLIEVLNQAGWEPVEKTKTHIDAERELNRLKYNREGSNQLDLRTKELHNKLQSLSKSGWKINEKNLDTLPDSAPSPARLLAQRILLEARRRTLTEWLELVSPQDRIHGKFYGIGAWTHRMAHQNPNTANIPTDAKLYGKEMRSLWRAPRNRLLVGVDAEGIQLRVFAHYINDEEFIHALVKGKKEDHTDPHSLNARILQVKSRNHAKRFIFAYLLGAGVGKLAQILDVSEKEGRITLDRLVERYQGLQYLKDTIIPADAKRGWFVGLDGRAVKIPGETAGTRKHLCMSGYLQNGEAVIMKMATLKWHDMLDQDERFFKNKERIWKLVDLVHDEWQTETANNIELALALAAVQADSLRTVGEELKLLCPLSGSYWNDDNKEHTIGINWYQTH